MRLDESSVPSKARGYALSSVPHCLALIGNDVSALALLSLKTPPTPFHRRAFETFKLTFIIIHPSLSSIQLFATQWNAPRQVPLSSTVSPSLLKFMFIESVMLSISSSATFFSYWLQFFPASGSFLINQLFASGDQNTGASTSVLPMNIQG